MAAEGKQRRRGDITGVRAQGNRFYHVRRAADDLSLFLRAVRVSKEEKEQLIDTVFQNAFDHDMCNFLKLLVSKDRTYYLKEILGHFIALCNDDLGIECAEVSSARQLSEEDYERIRKALEKMRGKTIQLTKLINPALIAGIRVKIGSTVMDATVEKQIDDMKKNLIEEMSLKQ